MKQNYLYEFTIDYPVVKKGKVETIIKAGTRFKGFEHFKLTTGLSDFKFRRIIRMGLVKIVTKKSTTGTATNNNENKTIINF